MAAADGQTVEEEAAVLRQQIAIAQQERDGLLRWLQQERRDEAADVGVAGTTRHDVQRVAQIGVEGVTEDVQQFAAVADTIQLYRQCTSATVVPIFPKSMRLNRHELAVIFGDPTGVCGNAGMTHQGFFGALVGFDQCASRDDLVAYVGRHTGTGVAHLLVAAADDRQDGRLAANDVANVMRLVKHFIDNYALRSPSAEFAADVLEQIAAEVRELDETDWTSATAVSTVRVRILSVEHLPATADGDFECGVSVLQQEFLETTDDLDSDTESEAGDEYATKSGKWSDSFKVIGRTEQRTAYPAKSGHVGFALDGPGFSCLAPGILLLKLGDHNWLHDNVEGSRTIMLDGSTFGQQRVTLQRNGAAVIGVDGSRTEIVLQVEPFSRSIPSAERLSWRAPMEAVTCDLPSEVSQAMVCCAETVKSYKRHNGSPRHLRLDSTRLDEKESAAAAELYCRMPPLEGSHFRAGHAVQARLVHARMAREATGKFPEGSVLSEVMLLLLSFASSGDTVTLSEFGQFLSLLKHFFRKYATSDVDFCSDILDPLMMDLPQPALQPVEHGGCTVEFSIRAVEHPPALESASILLFQQGCYHLLGNELQNPDASSVMWGQSNQKLGGVDFQCPSGGSTVCFSAGSARFECVVPGHVQLKLVSTAGLTSRLIGSTWLSLPEVQQGQSGRIQLVRGGAPVFGADGPPTTIEYSTCAVPTANQMWESDSSSSPLVIDRHGRAHGPLHNTLRRLTQERERREEQQMIEKVVMVYQQQQQRLRDELQRHRQQEKERQQQQREQQEREQREQQHLDEERQQQQLEEQRRRHRQHEDARRRQPEPEQEQQELETATLELHELEAELTREKDLATWAEQQLARARAETAMMAEELAALREAIVTKAARSEQVEPTSGSRSDSLHLPPATVATQPNILPAEKPQSADSQQELESTDGWHVVAPPTRVWARIGTPAVDPAGSSVFLKVLQYNILADHLASPLDRVDRYVYDQCPRYAISWAYRLELLLLELQGYDADVLCLQEVQRDHFEDSLRPRLRHLGYDGIFGPRNTELAPEKIAQGRCPDGVAIFFRSARLELLDQQSVVYRAAAAASPRNRDDSGEEDEVETEENPLVLPQGSDLRRTVLTNEGGALLALLQTVGTGARVCCVSTHLWHEPTRPDVRCVQTALLTKEVRRMVRRAGHGTGVVMCGDFNSEHSPGAGGGVYKLLSTGRLSVEHEDHPVARRSARGMADLTCTPMSSAYAQNGWVRLLDF